MFKNTARLILSHYQNNMYSDSLEFANNKITVVFFIGFAIGCLLTVAFVILLMYGYLGWLV